MSIPNEELFPGFKTPPNDPSRDVQWKRNGVRITPQPDLGYENDDSDFEESDEREYCATCGNTGYVDCHCGGDLCVCRWNGERPCPNSDCW